MKIQYVKIHTKTTTLHKSLSHSTSYDRVNEKFVHSPYCRLIGFVILVFNLKLYSKDIDIPMFPNQRYWHKSKASSVIHTNDHEQEYPFARHMNNLQDVERILLLWSTKAIRTFLLDYMYSTGIST